MVGGEVLEWAGSHLGVVFSPDNKFLVTGCTTAAWLAAGGHAHAHDRLSGRSGRCPGARAAIAGDVVRDTVIIWPFASKDGPMARSPRCSPLRARSPWSPAIRTGYFGGGYSTHHSDGRLNDGRILVRRTTRLAHWPGMQRHDAGFGAEDGDAGLLEL